MLLESRVIFNFYCVGSPFIMNIGFGDNITPTVEAANFLRTSQPKKHESTFEHFVSIAGRVPRNTSARH